MMIRPYRRSRLLSRNLGISKAGWTVLTRVNTELQTGRTLRPIRLDGVLQTDEIILQRGCAMNAKSFTRRGFLKTTLAAGTAPWFVPAHVLGSAGQPAPSE